VGKKVLLSRSCSLRRDRYGPAPRLLLANRAADSARRHTIPMTPMDVLDLQSPAGDGRHPTSTDMLSVMHVTAPGIVGGLERVVHALAVGHRALGHEVRVVSITDPGDVAHELAMSVAARGVEVSQLALSSRAYFRERAAIADLCRRTKPDVVHTHGYRPDVIDASVARSLGIPTVTTVHGTTGGDWKNRCYERLQRRAFRRFDAVVAVSAPLAQALLGSGIHRDQLHIIRNAYQPVNDLLGRSAARRALSIPDDRFAIGYVGRLGREKGADVLLSAAAKLRDLPMRQSHSLGIASRVIWHGTIRDAGGLLRAFDVFVLSSRTEGTPIVLLEAMGAGVPIVATRVGGVPDVVGPMEAMLVSSDDPEALAIAIRAVRDDPGAARRRAAAATARLEREFGHVPWLRQYETVYRSVKLRGRASS